MLLARSAGTGNRLSCFVFLTENPYWSALFFVHSEQMPDNICLYLKLFILLIHGYFVNKIIRKAVMRDFHSSGRAGIISLDEKKEQGYIS
jgi:hypothetical protein